MALRLISNLILTRLLYPEAFGLVGMITIFLMGLEMLSDIGIYANIVRHPRGDEERFLNTLWTVQIVRGLMLTIVALLLSWPVAIYWFRKPDLVPLMMFSVLTLTINGFNSSKHFAGNRRMEYRRITINELTSQLFGTLVTIGLSIAWRSVWALVVGSVSVAFMKVMLGHLLLPGYNNRLDWDREAVREARSFGKWIMMSSSMLFLSGQLDRILLGRYLDEATLGIYSVAYILVESVARLVSTGYVRVIFPALSRVHLQDPGRFQSVFFRLRNLISRFAMPLTGFIIGISPSIIHLMYDQRYADASWMFQILAMRLPLICATQLGFVALLAIDSPRYQSIASALKSICVIAGIPIGMRLGGVAGAVWAVGVSELPIVLPLIWGLRRHRLFRARIGFMDLLVVLVFAALGHGIHTLLEPHLSIM
jgi:O-antigen/teichoic acid export membrane protein